MIVKVTIEVDGDQYTAECPYGEGREDDEAIGRAVGAALNAIDGVDENLCLSMMLAYIVLAPCDSPVVMKASAQAFLRHDINPEDRKNWRLLVDRSVWEAESAKRDVVHHPVKCELMKEMTW